MSSARCREPASSARERILGAAYELFSRRGIRAVGTDEVIERAGVAKATLYRHFATKNDLVLAVSGSPRTAVDSRLDRDSSRGSAAAPRRNSCWRSSTSCTTGSRTATATRAARSSTCCSSWGPIIRPGRPASLISTTFARSCASARWRRGCIDVEDFAWSWHILMKGAIILAAVGDLDAALRAQKMARGLIEQHRPPGRSEVGGGGQAASAAVVSVLRACSASSSAIARDVRSRSKIAAVTPHTTAMTSAIQENPRQPTFGGHRRRSRPARWCRRPSRCHRKRWPPGSVGRASSVPRPAARRRCAAAR